MSLDEITTKYQQVCVNEDLQLALDKLGLDVILNAMLTQDMESTTGCFLGARLMKENTTMQTDYSRVR